MMKVLVFTGEPDKMEELQRRFKYHTTLERLDTNLFIHFAVKGREIVRVKINDEILVSHSTPDLLLYSVADSQVIKEKIATNLVFVVVRVTETITISSVFDTLHHILNQ